MQTRSIHYKGFLEYIDFLKEKYPSEWNFKRYKKISHLSTYDFIDYINFSYKVTMPKVEA